MSDINSEIESLKKDPERELNKMKSSSNAGKDRNPPTNAPNMSGPPNDAPNMSGPPTDAPNVKQEFQEKEVENKKEKSTQETKTDTGKKDEGNGQSKTPAQDKNYDELYKFLDIVLSTIVSKLKLVFMMPYIFFRHYVKDFMIENKSKEQIKREVKPAVITSFCVLGLQLVISILTKDFNMVKVLPVFGALVFCLMDADNTNSK